MGRDWEFVPDVREREGRASAAECECDREGEGEGEKESRLEGKNQRRGEEHELSTRARRTWHLRVRVGSSRVGRSGGRRIPGFVAWACVSCRVSIRAHNLVCDSVAHKSNSQSADAHAGMPAAQLNRGTPFGRNMTSRIQKPLFVYTVDIGVGPPKADHA